MRTMDNLKTLPLRPRDALPSFTLINGPTQPQPPQLASTSHPLTNHEPHKLRARIFAKLSLIDPSLKATIVTSNTNGECYAHVIDESEKVRYSSMAQESIKVALEVLLALVEEDIVGSVKVEDMELEVSEEEEEEKEAVDYEMDVD
ncbi:hypothetical protein KCU71_g14452, partial [Aureobasidium melanogenum]